METPLRSRHLICFGAFEFDPHTGELRKHGMKLKLHGHAIDALVLLLEHPGELVTREELRKRLWPADTFVDFEHSLNAAVKRLREALDDSADKTALHRDAASSRLPLHRPTERFPHSRFHNPPDRRRKAHLFIPSLLQQGERGPRTAERVRARYPLRTKS